MDKNKNKMKNEKEPNYLGVANMERIFISQPHLFAESLVRQTRDSRFDNLKRSQSERLSERLVNLACEMNFEAFAPFIPQVDHDILVARTTKKFLVDIKTLNKKNLFGSIWNEWSAGIAAHQLGIPLKDLHQIIDGKNPSSNRLRQTQNKVSEEMEALVKRSLSTSLPENLKRSVLLETWITGQIEEVRKQLEAANISKSEKETLIFETLKCLLSIINFSIDQRLNVKQLRDQLLNTKLDNGTINLVALHCLSFRNSPVNGISVTPKCDEFVATNRDGSKVLITQNDSLDKVEEFAQLLRDCNVRTKITVVVIDNDAFVESDQEQNIASFCRSLEGIIHKHPIGQHESEIIRATDIMNTEDLGDEWLKTSEKTRELLVDEEFEKLNRRTLPAEMQTRRFAREIARRNFLVQVSMGFTISKLFDNSITLQRAKAHQQATRLFTSGAKLAGNSPVIITHWKNMSIIE